MFRAYVARALVPPSMLAVVVIAAVVVGILPGAVAASSSAATGHEVVTVDVGWAPSSNIPWSDLTQIDLFNLATEQGPNLDTSNIANVNVPQWVAAAHSHGVKALVQIGGEGNNNWGTACNDAN